MSYYIPKFLHAESELPAVQTIRIHEELTVEVPRHPARDLGVYALKGSTQNCQSGNARGGGRLSPVFMLASAEEVNALSRTLGNILQTTSHIRAELADWVETVLFDSRVHRSAREKAATYIPLLHPNAQVGMIQTALEDENLELHILYYVATNVALLPEHEQKTLKELVKRRYDSFIKRTVFDNKTSILGVEHLVHLIQIMPEDVKYETIKEGLENPHISPSVKLFFAECIPSAPPDQQATLKEIVLHIASELIGSPQKISGITIATVSKLIPYVPEDKRKFFVTWLLTYKSDNPISAETAAMAGGKWVRENTITEIPQYDRADIIIATLRCDALSWFEKAQAIFCIPLAPKEDKEILSRYARETITHFISDPNVKIPDELIVAYCGTESTDTKQAAEPEQQISETNIDNPLTTSPLHDNADPINVIQLEKSGITYILPEAYEQAVRVIPFSAYAEWLKLYIAAKTWQDAGFHYIPIEPIMGIQDSLYYDDHVAVTTCTLRGESIAESIHNYSPVVQTQVRVAQARIKQVLKEMGITHGHDHDSNFVLVPQTMIDADGNKVKDENGKVIGDPSKMPRIYMIDFDMATS